MRRRKPEVIEVDVEELLAILELARTAPLSAEHCEILKVTIETHSWMMAELEKKNASLARIRKALSINTKKTEKTSEVLKGSDDAEQSSSDTGEKDGEKPEKIGKKPKKKPKGHGRNGADAYKGAEKIEVPHESLKPGDSCPKCESGKLYQQEPSQLVRLTGQAPISATLWELERLRCNLCSEVFTATPPAEVGEKKYDEMSASMIALLKYGSGLPFNRLAGLEGNFGIPLPASTQWGVIAPVAEICAPVYKELIRTGAQGDTFYHDDTTMKVLALLEENQRMEEAGSKGRTGMFTTCVVALWEGHQIALFFTGRQHAGENLKDVLEKRAAELDPPIQMCDGSSRNESEGIETFLANCLTHGRRKFVEVTSSFPGECRYVLEALGQVYMHDATTREQGMSPEERLRFHQDHSAEIMADLKRWMEDQLAQKKVEPSSSLGGAFSYMLKRWAKLTLFLRKAGAPLDNNICERALKKAILHRKNSLFYKTLNGARVGDIFMSLIHTAERAGANPFDYLTELQKHAEEVRSAPHQWMPWNYRETLAALDKATDDRQLP
jgi:transposase